MGQIMKLSNYFIIGNSIEAFKNKGLTFNVDKMMKIYDTQSTYDAFMKKATRRDLIKTFQNLQGYKIIDSSERSLFLNKGKK
jgi:hypothetical protein